MLKAGKYYVGDLCYVLDEDNGFDWDTVLHDTGFLGMFKPGTKEDIDRDEVTGYFEFKGTKFFSSGTAYGDGCFQDQDGREYGVDAGLIGCFPVDMLGANAGISGGHVIEFKEDFSCNIVDDEGNIEIGYLRIETDPSENEHDDLFC